jgi:hypothetical protein
MAQNNEVNFAERDWQIRNAPTDAMAYRLGQTHKAYEWSRTPLGTYNEHQRSLYNRGYDGLSLESA